jgi:hypothetical protein
MAATGDLERQSPPVPSTRQALEKTDASELLPANCARYNVLLVNGFHQKAPHHGT